MSLANVTFHRVLRDGNVVVKLIATVDAANEQQARELAMGDIRDAVPIDGIFAGRQWTWDEDGHGNENAEIEWHGD